MFEDDLGYVIVSWRVSKRGISAGEGSILRFLMGNPRLHLLRPYHRRESQRRQSESSACSGGEMYLEGGGPP